MFASELFKSLWQVRVKAGVRIVLRYIIWFMIIWECVNLIHDRRAWDYKPYPLFALAWIFVSSLMFFTSHSRLLIFTLYFWVVYVVSLNVPQCVVYVIVFDSILTRALMPLHVVVMTWLMPRHHGCMYVHSQILPHGKAFFIFEPRRGHPPRQVGDPKLPLPRLCEIRTYL